MLVICSKWGSVYPTSTHERRGKEVRPPAAVVEATGAGRSAALTDEREKEADDEAEHTPYPDHPLRQSAASQ